MILADVNLGDLLWSMLLFFFLFIWIMILFSVIGDLFRDKDESGFKKFLRCIFLIFLPFITLFVYVIVRGKGLERGPFVSESELLELPIFWTAVQTVIATFAVGWPHWTLEMLRLGGPELHRRGPAGPGARASPEREGISSRGN